MERQTGRHQGIEKQPVGGSFHGNFPGSNTPQPSNHYFHQSKSQNFMMQSLSYPQHSSPEKAGSSKHHEVIPGLQGSPSSHILSSSSSNSQATTPTPPYYNSGQGLYSSNFSPSSSMSSVSTDYIQVPSQLHFELSKEDLCYNSNILDLLTFLEKQPVFATARVKFKNIASLKQTSLKNQRENFSRSESDILKSGKSKTSHAGYTKEHRDIGTPKRFKVRNMHFHWLCSVHTDVNEDNFASKIMSRSNSLDTVSTGNANFDSRIQHSDFNLYELNPSKSPIVPARLLTNDDKHFVVHLVFINLNENQTSLYDHNSHQPSLQSLYAHQIQTVEREIAQDRYGQEHGNEMEREGFHTPEAAPSSSAPLQNPLQTDSPKLLFPWNLVDLYDPLIGFQSLRSHTVNMPIYGTQRIIFPKNGQDQSLSASSSTGLGNSYGPTSSNATNGKDASGLTLSNSNICTDFEIDLWHNQLLPNKNEKEQLSWNAADSVLTNRNNTLPEEFPTQISSRRYWTWPIHTKENSSSSVIPNANPKARSYKSVLVYALEHRIPSLSRFVSIQMFCGTKWSLYDYPLVDQISLPARYLPVLFSHWNEWDDIYQFCNGILEDPTNMIDTKWALSNYPIFPLIFMYIIHLESLISHPPEDLSQLLNKSSSQNLKQQLHQDSYQQERDAQEWETKMVNNVRVAYQKLEVIVKSLRELNEKANKHKNSNQNPGMNSYVHKFNIPCWGDWRLAMLYGDVPFPLCRIAAKIASVCTVIEPIFNPEPIEHPIMEFLSLNPTETLSSEYRCERVRFCAEYSSTSKRSE